MASTKLLGEKQADSSTLKDIAKLALADVFENFMRTCKKHYKLDHATTSPVPGWPETRC